MFMKQFITYFVVIFFAINWPDHYLLGATQLVPVCRCDPEQNRCHCIDTAEHQSTIPDQLKNCNKTLKSISFTDLKHLQNTSLAIYLDNFTHCQHSNSIIELTLTNNNLVRLNSIYLKGFDQLKFLNLSFNHRLNNYGDKSFEAFGLHLETLIAVSNPVRSLTRDVFRGLINMKRLILSNNKIGYIEKGIFESNCCQNLRELRLNQNILIVLDTDSFIGLTNLEILDLRQNPLQHLDSDVFVPFASSLIELRLSHNDQTSFGGFAQPPQGLFKQLHRLMKLELAELKLTNLTKDTFIGLDSLRELSLRGNRLVQLPPELFTPMSQLQYLDLAANWLICIPISSSLNSQIDFLSGLSIRWLDLSWNRLTYFDQLTARSLSLFDEHTSSQTRLILNLTANPWQKFTDDAFCNPDGTGISRPVDLVLGPMPAISFVHWQTSFGFWLSRAMWPNGPFSLVGNSSLITGLMLDEKLNADVNLGSPIAYDICKYLVTKDRQTSKLNIPTSDEFLLAHGIGPDGAVQIKSLFSSQCPYLPIRKMKELEMKRLNVSTFITNIDGLGQHTLASLEQGSRLYLLVIVGVCITFLLVALTIIMCYRAWSRRSLEKSVKNDVDQCDHLTMTNAFSADKPLLLKHRLDEKDEHSSSYPNSKLTGKASNSEINNCNGDLCGPITTTTTTAASNTIGATNHFNSAISDQAQTIVSGDTNSHQTRNSNRIISIVDRKPIRNRPVSDPELAGLEEINELTSLGIV